ncbi:MAG: carboxypeptidase-like regulatory domain-containing protein [Bacteroidota bacterium]
MQVAVEHGIQLSFDDQLLSGFIITARKNFKSTEEVLDFLIRDFPLQYEKVGEAYTIYSKHPPRETSAFRLSGQVIDKLSHEALPFSHMLINNSGIITDFYGNFTFTSTSDSIFKLKVSYLGYYIHDTVLCHGTNHVLGLVPSIIGLNEVVIEGSAIERSGQAGEEAGVIRLNHKIAYRLPGSGDNALFNFLRLQPGILAAGERSSEMIIWGSYSGQSQVIFDGINIFGLKNFNDNISFVNPYMAKDIRVLKGGFNAEYGDRVGGIVDISGINGDFEMPSINLNINNMTVNGMASIPLNGRSSITFAYRHTYYNFYDEDDLRVITMDRPNSGQVDINIFPDYLFRDINLKYAGSTVSGDDFYISLYEGRDQFSYSVDQVRNETQIKQDSKEENRQSGGTLFYGKIWENGNNSHLSASFSRLSRDFYEKQKVISNIDDSTIFSTENLYINQIFEFKVKNDNHIAISTRHMLKSGWSYAYDNIGFQQDSVKTTIQDTDEGTHSINLYVQDDISLSESTTITPGVRLDYPVLLGKVYIQPRIQASVDLSERWRINGSWGIYHQYISETSMIDDLGNYRNFWAICDNRDVPVLAAWHLIGGISYRNNGFNLNIETFFKRTNGITRLVSLPMQEQQAVYQGQARAYGIDILFKKYLRKHEAWVSYTLSKTEEYFPYFPNELYTYAQQDQRHEIKAALLLNIKPFYFTVNYVYGSGFPDRPSFFNEPVNRFPYNRLDAALIYRHSIKDFHIEAGFSVLNVLNHENIKYSNFIRIPDAQSNTVSIHAEAVPFTPTIYLNLSF